MRHLSADPTLQGQHRTAPPVKATPAARSPHICVLLCHSNRCRHMTRLNSVLSITVVKFDNFINKVNFLRDSHYFKIREPELEETGRREVGGGAGLGGVGGWGQALEGRVGLVWLLSYAAYQL